MRKASYKETNDKYMSKLHKRCQTEAFVENVVLWIITTLRVSGHRHSCRMCQSGRVWIEHGKIGLCRWSSFAVKPGILHNHHVVATTVKIVRFQKIGPEDSLFREGTRQYNRVRFLVEDDTKHLENCSGFHVVGPPTNSEIQLIIPLEHAIQMRPTIVHPFRMIHMHGVGTFRKVVFRHLARGCMYLSDNRSMRTPRRCFRVRVRVEVTVVDQSKCGIDAPSNCNFQNTVWRDLRNSCALKPPVSDPKCRNVPPVCRRVADESLSLQHEEEIVLYVKRSPQVVGKVGDRE